MYHSNQRFLLLERSPYVVMNNSLIITFFNDRICLRFCDIRGLPDKGLTRSRSYWITARVTVGKCSKKCRAVRVNEQDATTSLNEELHFLGSAGDSLHVRIQLSSPHLQTN